MEGSPSQFGQDLKNCYMLKFGLKAKVIEVKDRKPAVLTFVIDVSGSMQREDRLELVKKALKLLIDELTPEDMIGIAIYRTEGEVYMEHKSLKEKDEILHAIEKLYAEWEFMFMDPTEKEKLEQSRLALRETIKQAFLEEETDIDKIQNVLEDPTHQLYDKYMKIFKEALNSHFKNT